MEGARVTTLSRVKPTTPAGRRIHHKGTEAQPPGPPPIRETNIPTKIQVTRAPSIAVDKNNRKIYQRKPPTPEYEQQWAPNTIQAVIMICNAKGVPNAIAQKTVR